MRYVAQGFGATLEKFSHETGIPDAILKVLLCPPALPGVSVAGEAQG